MPSATPASAAWTRRIEGKMEWRASGRKPDVDGNSQWLWDSDTSGLRPDARQLRGAIHAADHRPNPGTETASRRAARRQRSEARLRQELVLRQVPRRTLVSLSAVAA